VRQIVLYCHTQSLLRNGSFAQSVSTHGGGSTMLGIQSELGNLTGVGSLPT
jgi:hypothetical protein